MTETTTTSKQGRGRKKPVPLESINQPEQLQPVTDPGAIIAANYVQANMYIFGEIESAATSYFKIGYKLHEVRENKLYEAQDFKNVYEYAEMLFGFKKSSVANFIAVYDRFSLRDSDGNPTEQLDPKYSAFKYSQLTLMVSLTDAEIAQINPNMTYREIQAIKKIADPDTSKAGKKAQKEPTDLKSGDSLYKGYVTKDTWDRILDTLFQLMEKDCKVQISIN